MHDVLRCWSLNLNIMPCNYKRDYPANWKTEIRPAILKRAKNQCEQCGVDNRRVVFRGSLLSAPTYRYTDSLVLYSADTGECIGMSYNDDYRQRKYPIEVVLTIAHLDHNTQNNEDGNLKALCQRCHLNYDKELHRTNSKATRIKKESKTKTE